MNTPVGVPSGFGVSIFSLAAVNTSPKPSSTATQTIATTITR